MAVCILFVSTFSNFSSSGRTFCFERTDLGNIPPKISNIKAHSQKEEDKITVDFDFHYLGNCDLQVKILGIRSGVRSECTVLDGSASGLDCNR